VSSLSPDDNFVAVDRLGSVKKYYTAPAGTAYLPYGEEANPGAIANDQIKFATYTRDNSTGLDYADQRFFTSQFGRFLSADRFKQAAKANDSGSWNKYSYTRGDPVNRRDRRGTCDDQLFDMSDGSGDGGGDGDCGGDGSGGDGSICSSLGLVDGGNGQCEEPQQGTTPATPTCEDQLVDDISGFLKTKYPSLAQYASIFEIVGASDNIDPRLFAAIAVAENGSAVNNPFAIGPNGSTKFPSIPAALTALGKTLDKYLYTWNETTVSQLWSGNAWKVDPKKPWITTQPPGYCVGSGCQNTGNAVAANLTKQGGNPNSLAFPCKD
jgi:RHS repeat-associated protein